MKPQDSTKRSKPLSYYIGNALIGLSVSSFLFVYFPLIKLWLSPPPPVEVEKVAVSEDFRLYIPRLGIESAVSMEVDPWNPEEYQARLKQGVAHAAGTALPGGESASFLFAHSSDLPWRMTRYNTPFLRLGEVESGDEIVIDFRGERFEYKVTELKEVQPHEIEYLLDSSARKGLIIQACSPPGTALRRLLVFAE